MSGGLTTHPVHLQRPSNPISANANTPKSPNPSLDSSTNRYARPVSREPTNASRRRARPLPFLPSPHGSPMVGGGRCAAARLFILLSARVTDQPGPTRRTLRRAPCGARRRDQRSRGQRSAIAFPPLGVNGDRSREQTAAGPPGGGTHSGHGPSRAASDRAAVGTGLCAALFARREPELSPRHRDAFWVLDATASASDLRPGAQAALDAAARAAVRASGQNHAAPADRGGEAPRRIRHESCGWIKSWPPAAGRSISHSSRGSI